LLLLELVFLFVFAQNSFFFSDLYLLKLFIFRRFFFLLGSHPLRRA
jgi:hypothetical protein